MQDSLNFLVEYRDLNNSWLDINGILTVIISGVFSLIVAYLTSYLTRKNELDKVKDESRELRSSVNKTLLSIETENYRKLYDYKLNALKEIKRISFEHLEINKYNYTSIDELYINFSFGVMKDLLHRYIIEYSHLLNQSIVELLKSAYSDCEFAFNNIREDDNYMEYYDNAKSVHMDIKTAIELIENDMSFNISDFKNKMQ